MASPYSGRSSLAILAALGVAHKPESTPDRAFSYSRAVRGAFSETNAGSGINDQYRICFVWAEGGAEDVEVVDYH
jgi:toxin HigB-1